jgi:hypothetical protein
MQQWIEKHSHWILGVLLLSYFLLRLPVTSTAYTSTAAFSHDSAYLLIVARNLIDGLGFINQTNWLLFLNPAHLPMPFHNANPLVPVLIAGFSKVAGVPLDLAAVWISLLGHMILIASVYVLARWAAWGVPVSLGVAGLVAILPPQWQESLPIGVDSLATGLMLAMFACALPARSKQGWLWAGLFLGLSWLTRSTILLVMPGFLLWACLRDGWKKAFVQFAMMGSVALAVISPWLWHTAKVWGSPLRSDASYYWFQDYFAHLGGFNVEQYWRSLALPPSLSEAILRDPSGFLDHWMRGIVMVCYNWLSLWNHASKAAALSFLIALGCGLYAAWPWRRSPLFWMCCLGAFLTVLSLGIRAHTVELRYFAPINVMVGFLLIAPLTLTGISLLRKAALSAPLFLYLAFFVIGQDIQTYQALRRPSENLETIRENSLMLTRQLPAGAVVVSPYPYYFGYFSRLNTISPAYPGIPELLSVMKKYGAQYMLLPKREMDYYYAGAPTSLEAWFIPMEGGLDYQLFQLKTP